MKSIRNLLIMTLILVVLVSGSTAAFADVASDTKIAAKDLYQYGLLQGQDDDSLGLNLPCTKMECCVMLVRMLGAEEEVLADDTAECVFTDVPKWAVPYIAYLMDREILTGEKDGTFGADISGDLSTYTLMLLRAMGYTGIQQKDAISTAISLQLFSEKEAEEMQKTAFTRGTLVFLTWRALDMPTAPGSLKTFLNVLKRAGLLENNSTENMPKLEAPVVEKKPAVDPMNTKVVSTSKNYLGVRYRTAGCNPSTGFDCSGFVNYVLMKSGAHSQWYGGCDALYSHATAISASEAQPGDLVFFTGTYSTSRKFTHVGIYLGNGQMIHASSSKGVSYGSIYDAYWGKHLYGFARW